MMRYQAIIFDMGDIFFDASIWRKWLTEYLQNLGVSIDYPSLCQKWEAKLIEVYLGRREYWERLREFLFELRLKASEIEQMVAASKSKAEEIENRTLFDGVAETLNKLKQMGVKLAVLSDTESGKARVRERLARLDIEQYFDVVETSIDIGYVKPQPEAYAAVLQRLASDTHSTIFVGHEKEELQGAMDFGLTTVAFNCNKQIPATHYIKSFPELIKVVCQKP